MPPLCPPAQYDALVLHLSNFRPVKRVDVVVEVFHRLRRSVRARLVLAGDGPDSAKVQARIAEYGLDEDVLLLPAQQDVVSLLSCADLFLLPSLEESFGLAALEAMACEVPVVASRVGGLPEVIDDGVTGAMCDPSDLDGMAARGLELLTDARLRADVAARRAGRGGAAILRRPDRAAVRGGLPPCLPGRGVVGRQIACRLPPTASILGTYRPGTSPIRATYSLKLPVSYRRVRSFSSASRRGACDASDLRASARRARTCLNPSSLIQYALL